jgi:acetylglutamate kinase
MRILVKLGGTLLDSPASRDRIADELAAVHRAGEHTLTVVHGGGKQMTRFLNERGIESRFVNGLRVSTPEVMDAVLKVFAGSVNKSLTSALIRAGVDAVGITGIDAALTEAEPMSPELGAVGRVTRTNPKLLDTLVNGGFLPVVACVAGSREGDIFNVNADQMAVACAVGFQAQRLFFMTDVEGVLDAAKATLPRLTLAESQELIETGVATGGMQAKLNAAQLALRQGVEQVVIAPGFRPGVLALLIAGQPAGTALNFS